MCKIRSFIVAALLSLPISVYAQNPSKPDAATVEAAKKHFDEAAKAFAEKNYDEAAKQYEAAYNLIPDTSLLNNIAYCYLKKEDFEEAKRRYQTYLDMAPYANNRAQVEATIKDLDKKIADKKQKEELEQKRKEAEEAAKKLQDATSALTKLQEDIKQREEEERRRREEEKSKALTPALDPSVTAPKEKNPTKTLLWLSVGTAGLAAIVGASVGAYGYRQSKKPPSDKEFEFTPQPVP